MSQFALNYERTKKIVVLILILTGLTFFGFFFRGGVSVSYAEETQEKLLSTFGDGKILVRLYTDYFCGPCKAMEPKIEPLLKELVAKNIVSVTFIDTPIHRYSALYARYFLYSLNQGQKSLEFAFFIRNALIEAANKEIDNPQKLEEHLKTKGIKPVKFDPNPIFASFTRYLKEDRVNATPTCVIVRNGKKDTYVGEKEIIEALKVLTKR
ncbi:MAG: thioredoxin domain-containing protein [Desulfobacterota bacterium]|nr:thioredoxin domain-containing protein [Thermodesulfobacteriota bacterium]MDW8001075.1 thioredoxin domain-containing protein [Deltaproteobacteria bacterium]